MVLVAPLFFAGKMGLGQVSQSCTIARLAVHLDESGFLKPISTPQQRLEDWRTTWC
ncbi:unnamed protein product [Choristocarpus tenellus]